MGRGSSSPFGDCLSPKLVWQALRHGGTAAHVLYSSLPEDPTWTIAFIGAGLTAAYFYLRTKEERATDHQATMPEIVARDKSVFVPRDHHTQYIAHYIHNSSSRSLLVAGPKNSGVTLLVSDLLAKSTLCVRPGDCPARHRVGDESEDIRRTSSRVGIRSRCWVGVQGLVTNLQSNFASTKFSSVISFLRNFMGSMQGTSGLSLEEMNELQAFREVNGDGAELLHQLKVALKINMNDVTPYKHVIFLDDLDTFSELAASWPETGQHARKIMFESMKVLAKNCKNVSVIGGGSPAMCYHVLHDLHLKDYFEVCFLGDLSLDNARAMFFHLWQRHTGVESKQPDEELFMEAYSLVGGRVSDIRDMVLHLTVMQRLRGSFSPKAYPCVARASTRLAQLLVRGSAEDGGEDVPAIDVVKPLWSARQVAAAFSSIANSGNPYGCVPISDLLETVGGQKVLQSMFEHDVLLYRPQCALYEDFEPNHFGDYAAPYSPLDLYCIRTSLADKISAVLMTADD